MKLLPLCVAVLLMLGPSSVADYTSQLPSLGDFIRHYELVSLTIAESDAGVEIDISAFGKRFPLVLVPDTQTFSPTHTLVLGNTELTNPSIAHIWTGEVRGKPGSFAHLSNIHGHVQGHFWVPGDDLYYVEPAASFFYNSDFHAVVFGSKHIVTSTGDTCSEHENLFKKDKDICSREEYEETQTRSASHSKSKYFVDPTLQEPTQREKRICSLHLRVDVPLWKHLRLKYRRTLSQPELQQEILALVASHVAELRRVLHNTRLKIRTGSQRFQELDFQIERTTVMTHASEQCQSQVAGEFCKDTSNVTQFLTLAAAAKQDSYCLAYLFTYRDFQSTINFSPQGHQACGRHGKLEESQDAVSLALNSGVINLGTGSGTWPAYRTQQAFVTVVSESLGCSPESKDASIMPSKYSDSSKKPTGFQKTVGGKDVIHQWTGKCRENITRFLNSFSSNTKESINLCEEYPDPLASEDEKDGEPHPSIPPLVIPADRAHVTEDLDVEVSFFEKVVFVIMLAKIYMFLGLLILFIHIAYA